MKFTKLLLTSTTALGLSMTAALADESSFTGIISDASGNKAFTKQVGSDNDISISQTGQENQAGRLGGATNASVQQSILQSGNDNEIDILQSGNNNSIGGSVNGTFRQAGQQNKADVTQSGNQNTLRTLVQVTPLESSTGQGNTYTSPRNRLIVTQSGDENAISVVDQWTSQYDKDGNVADVTISGNTNRIAKIGQISKQGGTGVTSNEMTVVISGNSNGRPSSGFGQGSLTGLSNVTASGELTQAGGDNVIDLDISGDRNQFGINQGGNNDQGFQNTVGALSIAGNDNKVGVKQFGSRNTVTLAEIGVGSDGNIIGITQQGFDNTASATVLTGSQRNEFGIEQDGSFNKASLTVDGNDNGVSAGYGLFGDAASVLNVTNGLIVQWGNDNKASLTIVGDNNAFGFNQDNESVLSGAVGNTIIGSVSGTYNAVAVAQLGDNNLANFTQQGNDNSLGITQGGGQTSLN